MTSNIGSLTARGVATAFLLAAASIVTSIVTSTAASAQTRLAGLVGTVRDTSGRPIPGVEIRFHGRELEMARTNDSGAFRFAGLPSGRASVEVRRLGFAPALLDVSLRPGETDSLALSLTGVAVRIGGVLVEDEYDARSHRMLAGFWERRDRGFGNFITRAEIEKRDPREFVDLARMVPGVTVQSRNGRRVIRFIRSASTSRDCPPQYFVDGMRVENASPDEFTPQDVEAVEIYAGPATTPPQFAPRAFTYTCGAVVIWTRIPG